jgi:hypothetical protein
MSPEQILGIFGLGEERELAVAVCNQQVKVAREVVIGTPGDLKRLDLVIRFGSAATLLIEIKRLSYERAGNLGNLEPYRERLDMEPGVKEAVLLVTEATEAEATEIRVAGWLLRTWRGVSLALRREAARICKSGKDLLKPGLWLCFAGAIEQNLLGFEVAATGYSPSARQTKQYLEEFLS